MSNQCLSVTEAENLCNQSPVISLALPFMMSAVLGFIIGPPQKLAITVHLILPSGVLVPIKLVSIKPAQLPGVVQTGFFDFPLDSKIPLSQLHMRFDTVDIPLAG